MRFDLECMGIAYPLNLSVEKSPNIDLEHKEKT